MAGTIASFRKIFYSSVPAACNNITYVTLSAAMEGAKKASTCSVWSKTDHRATAMQLFVGLNLW